MFAWLRKMWNGGQVPEPPDDCDLDFPEEEEWVFDFDAWKWVAQDRPVDEGPVEVDVFEDDEPIQLGVHESVPESRCCGGGCHLDHPPGK